MPDRTRRMTVDFRKEKGKWILVAALSVVLILVCSFYFAKVSSKGDNRVLTTQEHQGGVVNYSAPPALEDEPRPYLPTIKAKDDAVKDTMPFGIKDIFSFDSRGSPNGKESATAIPEEGSLVLKGTIIDGEDSIAFLNDEVLAIGDSLNGFTLVQIANDRAVLRNKKQKITVLLEDEIDEIF